MRGCVFVSLLAARQRAESATRIVMRRRIVYVALNRPEADRSGVFLA